MREDQETERAKGRQQRQRRGHPEPLDEPARDEEPEPERQDVRDGIAQRQDRRALLALLVDAQQLRRLEVDEGLDRRVEQDEQADRRAGTGSSRNRGTPATTCRPSSRPRDSHARPRCADRRSSAAAGRRSSGSRAAGSTAATSIRLSLPTSLAMTATTSGAAAAPALTPTPMNGNRRFDCSELKVSAMKLQNTDRWNRLNRLTQT